MTYTPGSWIVIPAQAERGFVWVVAGNFGFEVPEELAHLITAVPDLLGALENIEALDLDPPNPTAMQRRLDQIAEYVRAGLAVVRARPAKLRQQAEEVK